MNITPNPLLPPSRSGRLRRGQREFRVDEPYLQPAYRAAQRNATADGRSFLLYRDFYLKDTPKDVAEPARIDMGAARRHFRLQRGLPEGPDPRMVGQFRRRLQDLGIIWLQRGPTSRMSPIPKRYRRI